MKIYSLKKAASIICVFSAFLFIGCDSGEEKNEDNKKRNLGLNISFFLDISDHLDPNTKNGTGKIKMSGLEPKEYYVKTIDAICDNITNHYLKSKKRTITFDEHIKLWLNPIPSSNAFNEVYSRCDYYINKHNASKERFAQIADSLSRDASLIYEMAFNDHPNGVWNGSDIYSFLKKKDFYDDTKNNVLIILTDGYPFETGQTEDRGFEHDSPQWKRTLQKEADYKAKIKDLCKLSLPTTNLSGLKVMLVGFRQKNRPGSQNEEELVKELWRYWFTSMGVDDNDIIIMDKDDAVMDVGAKAKSLFQFD